MTAQKRTLFGLNLWLLDVALVWVSFSASYRLRSLVAFQQHALLPMDAYLWIAIVLAIAVAVILPLSGVYRRPFVWPQITRLSMAYPAIALTMFVVPYLRSVYLSSRALVLLALVVHYLLLVIYRLAANRAHSQVL